jgi:outer membrane protein TolC
VRRLIRAALLLTLAAPAALLEAQTPDSTVQPLSLVEAFRLADRSSEAVGIARAEVNRALGVRRQARSGYFPQLTAAASFQRTLRSQFSVFRQDTDSSSAPAAPSRACDRFVAQPGLSVEERLGALESAVACSSAEDPFANFRNLPFGRENTYRFGLSASQALFTGGRVGGLSQSADAGLRTAELGVTAAQAQTLLEVAQAYYDATLGERLVGIAEATLSQAETTLVQTTLSKQVGNQSEFELLRARVTRDNQRPVVIQRRAERDLAFVRLRQLLDLPPQRQLMLTTELGDTTIAEAPELAALAPAPSDSGVDRRLAVRQAAEAVRAQEGQLRVARSQRRPQLTLSSDFAELGYPGDGNPVGTDYLSDWTVSLGLSLPLFTGGRIKGEVDAARATVEQARLRQQQTRERAELDARAAHLDLAAALAAWDASTGTEAQAIRAYEIADLRYREGLSTQTELNELRIQLAQAQTNRARAARDLQLAKIRLALLPALPLPGTTTSAPGAAGGVTLTTGPTPAASVGVPGTTTSTGGSAAGVTPGGASR